MDPHELNLQWTEEEVVHHEEVCGLDDGHMQEMEIMEGDVIGACEEVSEGVCIDGEVHEETIIHTTDDLGTNTIMLMQQTNDMEAMYIPEDQTHDYLNIQVTEEVITDNWDRSGPDDGIHVPETKVSHDNLLEYDDMEIPLQSEQDASISSRPFPCDFCSRRFSKKANLMNHMVSHQTDRPYSCHFCDASYIRKCDLANHRKTHAIDPTNDLLDDNYDDTDLLNDDDDDHHNLVPEKRKKQTTTRKRKYTTKNTSPKRNYTINESKNIDKYNPNSYNYNDIIDIGNKYETTLTGTSSSSKWNDEIATEEKPRWPITDATKPYVCQLCGLGCARGKALKSHMRSHPASYVCTNCGDGFWSIKELKEHTRIKHGINDDDDDDDIDNDGINDDIDNYNQYVCDICGVMFTRHESLTRHRKIHVKQELNDLLDTSLHACNTCGETFDTALLLLAHAEIHSGKNSQQCLSCGAKFRDADEVAEHVRNCHGNASPNTCRQCGKQCKDKRSLSKHILVHSNDKSFTCIICDKKFLSKARLRRHKLSHEKKTVSCDECGIQFENGRALVSHKHSHKDTGNGRIFPCNYCTKTFGSRSSQQIHVRIHTGERPYSCSHCWKAFADGGTLRKHERIHTGEKPYACSICSRAFNQRVVLREHVRAHHSQPDADHKDTLTPYFCVVCESLFSTADEIIRHIIEHCDAKTAQNRQPPVGPRKYKRRRKTKIDQIFLTTTTTTKPSSSTNNHSNDDDDDDYDNNYVNNKYDNFVDGTSDSEENTKRKLGKKYKKQQRNIIEQEGYENVLKSFESSINNIDEIVGNSKLTSNKTKNKKLKLKNNNSNNSNNNSNNNNNSSSNNKIINDDNINNNINNKLNDIPLKNQSGRPKMIHTQKTRVPVDIGTDGVKKGQKTKTMVTRTPRVMPNEHKSGIFPGGERNRPRTKNVSYHVDGRIQIVPAVFGKINNDDNRANTATSSLSTTTTTTTSTISSTLPVNLLANIHIKTEPYISTRRSTAAAAAAAAAASSSNSNNNLMNTKIKTEPKKKTIKKNKKHLKTGFNENIVVVSGIGREEIILPDLQNVNHEEEIITRDGKQQITPQSLLCNNMHISDDHVITETIVPDSVDYPCDMCGNIFSSHSELSAHVSIHI
ncbi:uncharacterized protein LOC122856298 [Aphidius gifuensis]|uniref:uncharacterized protein LOC122856298 n=1 Tax=Aphidius gifuensis TaxID=684658 RepID=UPI001CDCFAE6|nr:uncharacterized protein LOC122856298 [Aphidius gifuensis]